MRKAHLKIYNCVHIFSVAFFSLYVIFQLSIKHYINDMASSNTIVEVKSTTGSKEVKQVEHLLDVTTEDFVIPHTHSLFWNKKAYAYIHINFDVYSLYQLDIPIPPPQYI